MLAVLIAPLPHHVPEQHIALASVIHILQHLTEKPEWFRKGRG
jgi:hypothetical protein